MSLHGRTLQQENVKMQQLFSKKPQIVVFVVNMQHFRLQLFGARFRHEMPTALETVR